MEEMVTRKVELDSAYAQSVLGINDNNLQLLDRYLDVSFHARGTTLSVRGTAAHVAVSYTHLTLPTICSV